MQDNQLQHFPDISPHPQLTALLLDSNQLCSISPATDGDSSTALPPHHSCLQTLSLANNQLTSLCGQIGASTCHDQLANTRGPVACSSSNSGADDSNNSAHIAAGSAPQQLSSWLPCLQVLRVSGNQLCDLSGLQNCSHLQLLDVSRNKLTSLQVGRYM